MSEPTNDIRERMQEVGRYVQTMFPPNTGFVILAFDLDTAKGRMEYIANAKRADVLKAMMEFIEINTQNPGNWAKHV